MDKEKMLRSETEARNIKGTLSCEEFPFSGIFKKTTGRLSRPVVCAFMLPPSMF
jgi:hypothetical protein